MIGSALISGQELAQRITDLLPRIADIPGSQRGERTKAIYKVLAQICRDKNPQLGAQVEATQYKFNAQASGLEDKRYGHEFLLDMVWWESDSAVVLAAESELETSSSERLRDFRKLLTIKAPLKLMIVVENVKATETNCFISDLEEVMQNWRQHLRGEEYVIYVFAGGINKAFSSTIDDQERPTRFTSLNIKESA